MPSALERMRVALRPHHDRIESTVGLMDPALTRDDYAGFLARTLGFVEPCETAVREIAGDPPLDLGPRWKTAALRRNLEALGFPPERAAMRPRADALPVLTAWPGALGYLYVMEGSTLGGQVLLRHLAPRLALTTNESVFLRGYDRQVGGMWKGFLVVLERALERSPRDESAIVETARETFVRLDAWHRAHRGAPRLTAT